MKYFFFPGCAYETSAGYKQSTEAVCRKLGIELIEVPDWNCCGATIMLGEDEFQAAALVGRIFAKAEQQGFSEIVTGCNACYTTLKKGGKLLFEHKEYLETLNRNLMGEGLSVTSPIKVRHLAEVMATDIPEEKWEAACRDSLTEIQVAVYYGCQYARPWDPSELGDRPQMLDDFFTRLGFTTVEHSAKTLCCGAAAAVPQQKECLPLVSRIIRGAKAKDADLIATVCPLCQFNVDSMQEKAGVSPLPVMFFTQLTGIALGLDPASLGLDKLIHPAGKVLDKLRP